VRFDDTTSSNATVVEVHAPNRVGLLHDITNVFAELQLDIRHARIVKLGDNVLDTFYLCDVKDDSLLGVGQKDVLSRFLLNVITP
jgi:[protein-PII] uridylyltransferase